MATSARLLSLTLPLIKTHGFTREALSLSVTRLPRGQVVPGIGPEISSNTKAGIEPLTDSAVSALFGAGEESRKTLINAWLDAGLQHMRDVRSQGATDMTATDMSVKDVLFRRLEYNKPVLRFLPEAFAILASPKYGIPLLDPLPAIKHATSVANEACSIVNDKSLQLEWYSRRASLASIYVAAELHQLTSPETTHDFLDSLFETSASVNTSFEEVGLYASYFMKSWRGIIKSSGAI